MYFDSFQIYLSTKSDILDENQRKQNLYNVIKKILNIHAYMKREGYVFFYKLMFFETYAHLFHHLLQPIEWFSYNHVN